MEKLLVWTGRLAGLVGVLICAVAVVARFKGAFWLGGLQVGTLLQGGMAAMLLGCLSLAVVLTWRVGSRD